MHCDYVSSVTLTLSATVLEAEALESCKVDIFEEESIGLLETGRSGLEAYMRLSHDTRLSQLHIQATFTFT